MRKKVKDSLNALIGSEPIFSEAKQRELLRNIERPQKKRRSFYLTRITPILGFIAFLLVGSILFIDYLTKNQYSAESTVEQKSSEATSYEKQEEIVSANSVAANDLQKKVNELEKENASLQEAIRDKQNTESSQSTTPLYPSTNSLLQDLGYSGTSEDIKEEVINHPELIPYDGVLGGTMQFDENRIFVISHEYVYAEFSDGHMMGYLILHYSIENGEATNWQIVSQYLDGE
ncbi:hypothetical protein OEV98_12430 [Caldibacillus lycopersici]|uniref:Uncharacterized protein n=1 Tax=Perspicuibacillus lycopersici TaxID=1325689 RepID=A0AAE3IVV6_9BACI|nr:hypothetical protein [Perspicuibacillus lycopersici]MCU9614344.1 hypothetical protein [Perspicuibacillus lycopersici]